MPAQEVAFLFDDATVWEFAGVDRDNEPTVLTPYGIKARWDETSGKTLDQTGQLINYDATIFTETDYPLGSIFWQGRFENYEEDAPVNLYRSISRSVTKDIRGMDTEYSYSLRRYQKELPDVVGTS